VEAVLVDEAVQVVEVSPSPDRSDSYAASCHDLMRSASSSGGW